MFSLNVNQSVTHALDSQFDAENISCASTTSSCSTCDSKARVSDKDCCHALQRVMAAVVCRQQQEQEWRERVRRMGGGAAGKQAWPGCTALAVLLHDNTMLVANAGPCLMPSIFCGSDQCMLRVLGLSAFMLIRSESP